MPQRLLIAIALLLALAVAGLELFWHPGEKPGAGQPAGGDFTLNSADGPVALADLRGKVVLVYFGYTYCPDICPTELAALAAGLGQLRPEEAERVRVIFVSVDPERDTPERLKEYARFFHPSVVGVTGTPAQLADVARRYGIYYARQKADTAGGYVVDHSSDVCIVAPDGRLTGRLPHAAPPAEVAAAIRKHL